MKSIQGPPDGTIRIETFQGLRVIRLDHRRSREATIPIGEKPGVLLVLLALAGEAGIPRPTIRTLLWPETSDANGSNSLRQALFRLRRALGADSLEDRAGRLYLRLSVSLDAVDVAQRLDGGDLAGALDIMSTPFGHSLDVAGPALRDWLQRYRHQLDLRLEALIRASWSPKAAGAVLAMLHSAVPIVRRIIPTSIDLLWIQLELDARQGEAAAFERHLQELRTLQRGSPVGPADEARLATLRQRMTSGAATPRLRPPSLHEEAHRTIRRRLDSVPPEGGTLWVTGPAGIGRSHLLRELASHATAQGIRVVQLTPLDGVPGLSASLCRDLAVALSALRGAAGLDPRYAPIIERLALGARNPLGGEAADALVDLAVAITAEGPLHVLIDDADRYDSRELHAVLSAIDDQRPRGLVVIVSAPPDAVPARLPSAPIVLAPLRREGVRQMVDQLARLPESAWSDALIDGLQRASDGIPRRILHLLATLLREGLLLERPVGWTPGGSEEGLRERLAQLGPNGLLS
jgi:DNA-binding SARP family transcriptional activator